MVYKDINGKEKEATYDEILKELQGYVAEYNSLELDTHVPHSYEVLTSEQFSAISGIFNMMADGTFEPLIWTNNLKTLERRGYNTNHRIQNGFALNNICYRGAKYLYQITGGTVQAQTRMDKLKPHIKYLQIILGIGVG